MSQTFLQVQPVYLSGSGITATATTIILKSLKFPQGDTVLTADLGDICYATLEPNTSREEIISFTTITQNSDGTATLTGITRNLDYASPYTQISATGYAHAGGTALIISNNPQVYQNMASNANDESITGTWTFDADAYPKVDDDTKMPTDQAEFVIKAYADALAIAGAPDATESVQGLVELATSAETIAGTDTGGTGAYLLARPSYIASNIQNSKFNYGADAGANDTYVITLVPAISAYATGQVFTFYANTANTGACTLNVNGKGAKTIKKLHDQDLEDGDIEAGSIVQVVYDGTNFQLLTPQATIPTTAIMTEMSTFFGSTDITGAEAETLTNGSNADSLHTHGEADFVSSGSESNSPLVACSNSSSSNTSDVYAKIKEITVGKGGSVYVYFTLVASGAASDVYGRIYVNDVAVGTERQTQNDSYGETVSGLTAGDKLQIYGKRSGAATCNVSNYRVYVKAINDYVVNT
jgi:hypothetical protein